MDQSEEVFDLCDLFQQMLNCISFSYDAKSLPGRLVVKDPVAEVSQRGHQIVSKSQYRAALGAWPLTCEYVPQLLRPDQPAPQEFGIQQELPGRKISFSDHSVMVADDVS